MKHITSIPNTVEEMSLKASGMKIKIRHADQAEITVSATNPAEWRIREGRIARIVSPEPVGKAPPPSNRSVCVGGKGNSVSCVGSGNVIVSGDNNVVVSCDGLGNSISIGGRKVPTPTPAPQPTDEIEIVVPLAFSVPLEVFFSNAIVEIDYWDEDKLALYNSGNAIANVGELTEL